MCEKSFVTEPLGPLTVTILDLIVTVTAFAINHGGGTYHHLGSIASLRSKSVSFCFIFFIK